MRRAECAVIGWLAAIGLGAGVASAAVYNDTTNDAFEGGPNPHLEITSVEESVFFANSHLFNNIAEDNGGGASFTSLDADVSFNGAFGYDVRAEVFGSGGMMAVGDGREDNASLYTAAGVTRAHSAWFKPMFGEAYTAELAHFVECARTGAEPAVTGADGRESLRMALAAIESCRSGRAVTLA